MLWSFLTISLSDQKVPTKVLGFDAAEERQNQRIDPRTQGELRSEPVDGGAYLLESLIHPQCVYSFKKAIAFKMLSPKAHLQPMLLRQRKQLEDQLQKLDQQYDACNAVMAKGEVSQFKGSLLVIERFEIKMLILYCYSIFSGVCTPFKCC